MSDEALLAAFSSRDEGIWNEFVSSRGFDSCSSTVLHSLLDSLPSTPIPVDSFEMRALRELFEAVPAELLDEASKCCVTLLHTCVMKSLSDLIDILVRRLPKDSLYRPDQDGWTPLHYADCSLDVVRSLVDALPLEAFLVQTKKMAIDDIEDSGETVVLSQCAKQDNDLTLAKAIVAAAPEEAFVIESAKGLIPLHVCHADVDLYRAVIDKTPEEMYGKLTADDWTILHFSVMNAVNYNDVEAVEMTLDILPRELFHHKNVAEDTALSIAQLLPRACDGELLELLQSRAPVPKGAM